MTGILTVEVHPIDWGEWVETWWLNTPRYWTTTPRHPNDWDCGHSLVELGDTTDGYRYTFFYKGRSLFNRVLRPPCCCRLFKCPIGHYSLPMSPCREHLRDEAKRMAYELWVQCLRDMGAANIPPSNTGDTDT